MIALPSWRKHPVYYGPPALRPSGQLKLFKIVPDDFVSLHAGVAAQAWERQKLERLCRYISRPAVSEKRLALTPSSNIRYDVSGFTNAAGAGMRKSGQLKRSTAMGPRTSSSIRWILLPSWQRWCRNPE
jgi:hypothetical protein